MAEEQPRMNVMEMAREGRQFVLGSAIREASASKQQEVVLTKSVWYMTHIMPYYTINNVIDGLVLTFVDINPLKSAEHSSLAGNDSYCNGGCN